jgi:hypothetical protein
MMIRTRWPNCDFEARENNPLYVIRQVVKDPPVVVTYSSVFWGECGYCGEKFTCRENAEDECLHDEECPWRMALELCEKLGL